MTVVTYRTIETTFEKAVRKPGGKKVSECLVEAYANLEQLAPDTTPRFQEGLDRLRTLVGPGLARPGDPALRELHAISDNLIGYCLTVNRPGLDQVLLRMAQLSDAVYSSDLWIPGTFAPLIETFQLTLDGSLELPQVSILIASIDLCIARYKKAERDAVAIDA